MALDGRKLRVTFEDGRTKVVDLTAALESRRIYKRLREDDALFRSFRISDFRNALEWSDDLDFSALWLDALPSVEFSNADFRAAMDELGMTLDGMAAALESLAAADRGLPQGQADPAAYQLGDAVSAGASGGPGGVDCTPPSLPLSSHKVCGY